MLLTSSVIFTIPSSHMSDTALSAWTSRDALSALMWLHDSGVEALVDDEPRNWLAAKEKPVEAPQAAPVQQPVPESASRAVAPSTSPPQSRHVAPVAARDLAAGAQDVAALREAVMAYTGCALRESARNTVFVDGNFSARAILFGEAPGEEEDRTGRPFAGPSGPLLDRMLAAIALSRDDVLISNVCFWRPPANRTPNDEELAHCLPFVQRLIALMQPRAILCLGATPARALMNVSDGITRLRGQWHSITCDGAAYPLLPTFHPTYLLRQPVQKRLVWDDLLSFSQKLKQDA